MNLTNETYLFESDRLGFRTWTLQDLPEFAELNADVDVMKHFPEPLTRKQSTDFIKRLQKHYKNNGYCYFATEIIETGEFIGFIGLAYQVHQTNFTPATDIGWRLKKTAWGLGFATEGAKRCLDFAFDNLDLDRIVSICTVNNTPSENVMKKIGMCKQGKFRHPSLLHYPEYEQCVWYEIRNNKKRTT